MAQNIHSIWLIAGDFNALLNDDDKQWGSRVGRISCNLFNKFINDFCLKDVRFRGRSLLGIMV